MFLSFIVPAFNEALYIEQTVRAIIAAAQAAGASFEVLVVNDASTDQTKSLAERAGARVIDVSLRKISAVRNAGAREAKGDLLFFVDGDTCISERVVRSALDVLEKGAVGGGAWVVFTEPTGWVARATLAVFAQLYGGLLGWAAGCFVFVRRDAFFSAGGFDETLYASEEIVLSRALKRMGRFVILRDAVTTSGRKMRRHSIRNALAFFWRFLLKGPAMLRDREGLEWWYDGKR